MTGTQAYALAKAYVADTAAAFGAVKGAPCQIADTTVTADSTIVKYMWKNNAGETKYTTVTLQNGLSTKSAEFDENGHFIITLTDDTKIDAGVMNLSPTITEDITFTVDVGGIKKNTKYKKNVATYMQMWKDLAQGSAAPTTTLTLDSDLVLDIIDDELASVTMTAKVVKGSNDLKKVQFYVAGTLVNSQDITTAGTYTYTHTFDTPVKANTIFKATATDSADKNGTDTKTVVFVGKSYYGILPKTVTSPVESDIKSLSNTLKNTQKFLYENIDCQDSKICYAYPKSLAALESIVDGMDLPYLTSYTASETTVDGLDYRVYLLTTQMTVDADEGFLQSYK